MQANALANDIVGDVTDAASLAAASIADAAKLADPATMAAAVVDLVSRVGQLETLVGKVQSQAQDAAPLLTKIEAFFKRHFPSF